MADICPVCEKTIGLLSHRVTRDDMWLHFDCLRQFEENPEAYGGQAKREKILTNHVDTKDHDNSVTNSGETTTATGDKKQPTPDVENYETNKIMDENDIKKWFIALMKSFTERLSNVLAWFGFAYPVLGFVAGIYNLDAVLELLGMEANYRDDDLFASLIIYAGFVAINYLISGRIRLLPELKKNLKDTRS